MEEYGLCGCVLWFCKWVELAALCLEGCLKCDGGLKLVIVSSGVTHGVIK